MLRRNEKNDCRTVKLRRKRNYSRYFFLKDDLGADSLDLFELVMALEDEYNIEIPAEELTELATVGDVIEYLKGRGIEA